MRLFDYIVWYKDIRPWYPRWWLCLAYNQSYKYYESDKSKAIRYTSRKEAKQNVPVYDGSPDIEKRTGVTRVLRKW